jgi:hypothetical protein
VGNAKCVAAAELTPRGIDVVLLRAKLRVAEKSWRRWERRRHAEMHPEQINGVSGRRAWHAKA